MVNFGKAAVCICVFVCLYFCTLCLYGCLCVFVALWVAAVAVYGEA